VTEWRNPPRPHAIAHRGACAYARESSLEAYRTAARLGADFWEIDIRLSSCRTLVCVHDSHLADGTAVADQSVESLQDHGIVPLTEVLALAKLSEGTGIYADIKDPHALLPTLDALRSASIERAVLGSFDPEISRELRERACPYLHSVLVPPETDPFEYAHGADIMHLCWEHMERPQDVLDAAFLAEAERRGQGIALWHEEDPVRMREIRHLPVFGICSDRPELVHPFQPPAGWPVHIVCHRGATEFAPENTLSAMHCAFAAGFSCVEIDVHSTRDGSLAVIHDPTLNRTTNGAGAVSWQTASDLAMLDAGSWMNPHFHDEGVPALRSVLDLARHYDGNLYIELKSADPACLLAEVIDLEMLDRCFFWSFDFAALKTLRALSPAARLMVRRQDHPSLAAAVGGTLFPGIIEYTLNDDWREFIPCRSQGLQVMIAYMGREPATFDRIIDSRPDFVNLHFPFAFRDHLHKRQRHTR